MKDMVSIRKIDPASPLTSIGFCVEALDSGAAGAPSIESAEDFFLGDKHS